MFYALDIAASLGIVALMVYLTWTRRISRYMTALFVVGCLLGAVWEFGLHFMGPEHSDDPIFILHNDWPLHPLLQPALHCFWDGALFLAGVVLVRRLLPGPHFVRPRLGEAGVLLAWGIGSALVVEISASGAWEYMTRSWNPALFSVGETQITLLPVLIWGIAPLVFYGIALWLRPRFAVAAEGGAQ